MNNTLYPSTWPSHVSSKLILVMGKYNRKLEYFRKEKTTEIVDNAIMCSSQNQFLSHHTKSIKTTLQRVRYNHCAIIPLQLTLM